MQINHPKVEVPVLVKYNMYAITTAYTVPVTAHRLRDRLQTYNKVVATRLTCAEREQDFVQVRVEFQRVNVKHITWRDTGQKRHLKLALVPRSAGRKALLRLRHVSLAYRCVHYTLIISSLTKDA